MQVIVNPRKLPRQNRAKTLVESIFTAATQVLESEGYGAATTSRIAERAGVSIGSLYQYFPNKDSIMGSLVINHAKNVARETAKIISANEIRPQPFRTLISVLIQKCIDTNDSSANLHRLLNSEIPDRIFFPEERRLVRCRVLHGFRNFFANHSHEIKAGDLNRAAAFTFNVIDSTIHQTLLNDPAQLRNQEFSDDLIELVSKYLIR
jgi:AcrR family transcriptional regulator